jgi:hypothetical protein
MRLNLYLIGNGKYNILFHYTVPIASMQRKNKYLRSWPMSQFLNYMSTPNIKGFYKNKLKNELLYQKAVERKFYHN